MSGNKNTARKLKHYKLVNSCETLEELADVIIEIAEDNNGWINGRTRSFKAQTMADNCLKLPDRPLTSLTHNYGIKDKAISILFYQNQLAKTSKNETVKVILDDIKSLLSDTVEYINHMT